jgi:hypothetical protein
MFEGGFTPIALYRLPRIAQAFFVGVSILRHDRGDTLGCHQHKAKPSPRSVVEYFAFIQALKLTRYALYIPGDRTSRFIPTSTTSFPPEVSLSMVLSG